MKEEDLLWMNTSSWLSFLSERKPSSYASLKVYGEQYRPQMGIEAAKKRLGAENEEFPTPKINYSIHSITEDGNTVVLTYTSSFVHDLPYYGIKPTNQKVNVNGVHIFTFHEDKIIKIVFMLDTYQILARMGDIILNSGDEKQIQQYMEMLRRQNLIPRGVDEKHE